MTPACTETLYTHIDARCLTLQALVEGHMLNSDEEASLRESLRFREEDRWLRLLYRSVIWRAASSNVALEICDYL